jgi:hypothetical protein
MLLIIIGCIAAFLLIVEVVIPLASHSPLFPDFRPVPPLTPITKVKPEGFAELLHLFLSTAPRADSLESISNRQVWTDGPEVYFRSADIFQFLWQRNMVMTHEELSDQLYKQGGKRYLDQLARGVWTVYWSIKFPGEKK